MAALEAASLSIFSHYPSLSKPSSSLKLSHSIKVLNISISALSVSHNFPLHTLINPRRGLCFRICSTVEEATVEAEREQTQEKNVRRKLFVFNLPWSLSVQDIKNLFGQCGTVTHVEVIKHKDGKNRNFAFVTMAFPEEAEAAVNKFDTQDVSGRIIRVEFAKKFKKPRPPHSASTPNPQAGQTQHKLYVSNLDWKVRGSHLREFFSVNFNPVSIKVVFESNSGRSAGYGFVSFPTKEEAEAAISSLDGKELMGRPLRLKLNERDDASESNEEDLSGSNQEDLSESNQEEEKDASKDQPAES